MANKPEISVVVLTYKRKEFLKEALQSVLSQTLPRHNYEVICVVGFRDPELSGFMRENGIQEVYFEENVPGHRIALGIEKSSADIVALLDDDDVFAPDKLRCVLEAFSKHNIVYYHNNIYLIDKDSRQLKLTMPYARQIENTVVCRPIRNLRYLLKQRGNFNNSSIVFKKSAILPYLQQLKKVSGAVDAIIFFLLLQGDPLFFFDSRKLTGYRIHDSTTRATSNFEPTRLLAAQKRAYVSANRILQQMWDPAAKKWFGGIVLALKFKAYLLGDNSLKPTPTETVRLFVFGVSTRNLSYLRLVAQTLASYVAPEAARTHRLRQIGKTTLRFLGGMAGQTALW